MKKLTMVLAIAAMSILLVSFASAQTDKATQTFNLGVNAIHKISVSGSPSDMIITDAAPGSDPTPVTNSLTTYSFTTNEDGTKITAQASVALGTGYVLTIGLDGNTPVNISTTAAQDAVTGIDAGAYNTRPIAYSFSATAAAGPLVPTGETVTLTVVKL
jgi:hypothetical protein